MGRSSTDPAKDDPQGSSMEKKKALTTPKDKGGKKDEKKERKKEDKEDSRMGGKKDDEKADKKADKKRDKNEADPKADGKKGSKKEKKKREPSPDVSDWMVHGDDEEDSKDGDSDAPSSSHKTKKQAAKRPASSTKSKAPRKKPVQSKGGKRNDAHSKDPHASEAENAAMDPYLEDDDRSKAKTEAAEIPGSLAVRHDPSPGCELLGKTADAFTPTRQPSDPTAASTIKRRRLPPGSGWPTFARDRQVLCKLAADDLIPPSHAAADIGPETHPCSVGIGRLRVVIFVFRSCAAQAMSSQTIPGATH